MPFVEIALPVPTNQTFTYIYDIQKDGNLALGSRILVPFGRRSLVGYAITLHEMVSPTKYKLKEILDVLDEQPVFSKNMLSLLKEMAEQTFTPLGEVLQVAVPAALHKPKTKLNSSISSSVESAGQWGGEPLRRSGEGLRPSAVLSGDKHTAANVEGPALNTYQQEALDKILKLCAEKKPETFLLHGVTGSGKTEIYLRAIEDVLKKGREVLMLTPEIGLTPQLVKRVEKRFGKDIGLYHSKCSQKKRLETWQSVKAGETQLVVGTRSSIFLPFNNLGLVIIDEEQDNSYKQGDHFRYQTRDIAKKRMEQSGGVLVLGSATPSIETYYQNKNHHYHFLPERATGASLPKIEICDMRNEAQGLFSRPLLAAIELNLANKQQTLLFLNRRGFATFIVCKDCGEYFLCPDCHISLTLHSKKRELHCHYCDYRERAPSHCPTCRGPRIDELGYGTERVESEIMGLYPEARVARLDRDTMTKKDAWPDALKKIDDGEIDILIGTQMVAKGHDYHGITLVGILNADSALNFPDFRASEKTFQQILQVSGRAGRGSDPGHVYVQTLQPDHACFQDIHDHDIQKFYNDELAERELVGYPPFSRLIRFEWNGLKEDAVIKAANQVADCLNLKLDKEIPILGPVPCPLQRLRNRFRWHLLIKVKDFEKLQPQLKELLDGEVSALIPSGVRFIIDVDPMNLI